ncbi:DUF2490 domain-containing protein [Flavobacterium sp. RSSA_27]|uniref:DUF2490 domain-containing protein n=1 Tax=Flavobacterium sp. RSSA_27 TaxID=3447667 RepID=UPI003F3B3D79
MRNKIFLLLLFLTEIVFAQSTRITDNNSIGWLNYMGTFKLNSKVSLHTEFQWRRDEWIKNHQQNLLRLGVNYQLDPKVQLRLGYALAETYPYGDIPINRFGKDFTEHRMYEMVTLTEKVKKVELSHRFLLEQRWIGRYSTANLSIEDDYLFSNRFRYMFRAQVPLKGNTISDHTPYVAIYDEILIGFGNTVIENIFDQNRFGLLFGYKFSSTFKLEAGYINQILQLGREINGRNVIQHNNGFIINTLFNFDLQNKFKTISKS